MVNKNAEIETGILLAARSMHARPGGVVSCGRSGKCVIFLANYEWLSTSEACVVSDVVVHGRDRGVGFSRFLGAAVVRPLSVGTGFGFLWLGGISARLALGLSWEMG